MDRAERAVRKKHRCRTHVRAALASVKVMLEDCDPEDRNDLLEAKFHLQTFEATINAK